MRPLGPNRLSLEPIINKKISDVPSFPWGPPTASATLSIPTSLFQKEKSELPDLAIIANKLKRVLAKKGYNEISWFFVPHGFAIVTRMEQFNYDGTPLSNDMRWQLADTSLTSFTIVSYLKSLFTCTQGYFRIFVFIVTPIPFTQDQDTKMTFTKADSISVSGVSFIPKKILNERSTKLENHCSVLIYEFSKNEQGKEAKFHKRSHISAVTHLKRSGIWDELNPDSEQIPKKN